MRITPYLEGLKIRASESKASDKTGNLYDAFNFETPIATDTLSVTNSSVDVFIDKEANLEMIKVVDNVIALIEFPKKKGLNVDYSKAMRYVQKNVTSENLIQFLAIYKNKTGTDFLNEINKNGTEDKRTQKFVDDVLEIAFSTFFEKSPETTKYLATVLIEDFYGDNKENIWPHLALMCSYEDFPSILFEYNKMAESMNVDLEKYKINLPLSNESYERTKSLTNLLSAINNEDTLNEELKTMVMNALINCSVESGDLLKKDENEKIRQIIAQIATADISTLFEIKNKYTQDIEYDLIQHRNDTIKSYIDIRRLARRPEQMEGIEVTQTNSLDGQFSQFRNTGSCWLLGGLISMINNDNAKKILEEHCTYNQENNTYDVYLAGVDKRYTISADDRIESSQYANGNSKIRAIEIAIDTYFKEIAYQTLNDEVIDINSNDEDELYRLFLGDSKTGVFEYTPESREILMNENKVFNFLFHFDEDIDTSNMGINMKDNTPALICNDHSFPFIKADNEYYYLGDTADSENIIKISIEDFAKLKATVGYGELE